MHNIKKTILFLSFCFAVKADDFKSFTATFIEGYADESVTSVTMEDQYKLLDAPEVLVNSIVLRASQIDRDTFQFKPLGKYIYRIESDDFNRMLFLEQQNIKESPLRLVRLGKDGKYAVTDGSIIISYIDSQLIFELVNELGLEVVSHLPRINVISVKTSNFNELYDLLETLQNNNNVKQAYLDIERQELQPR